MKLFHVEHKERSMKLTEFIVAAVLLALTPGPDILLVLTTSVLNGFKKGIQLALGLTSGVLFHTCVVALGVAALVVANPVLFNAVKYAGVCYLLYLGLSGVWQAEKKKRSGANSKQKSEEMQSREQDSVNTDISGRKLYFRGIMMNVLNPKVALFFLALFPQFLDPASNIPLNSLILGGVFAAVTLSVFTCVAVLSGYLGQKVNFLQGNTRRIAWIQLGVYLFIIGWLLFY